jgi:hypothetical protein
LKAGSSNWITSTPSACSAGFLVEQFGEGERHLDAVAVVLVGDGVDDGHRAGQGEFQLARGVGAGDARLVGMDAALQRSGATTCGTIAL